MALESRLTTLLSVVLVPQDQAHWAVARQGYLGAESL